MDTSNSFKKHNSELCLQDAIQHGLIEEFRQLIQNGASVFKMDSENKCALAIALETNNEMFVRELLSHYEVPLLLLDKQYDNPIYTVLNDKDIELISTWCTLDNIGTPVKIYYKKTRELKNYYVTNRDHLNILNKLYTNGLVDLNIKTKTNDSLLDIAVTSCNVKNVTNLLKLKFNNNINSENRINAFRKAIEKAPLNVIRELLKFNSFNELCNEDNRELLHIAAARGDVDIFTYIFEQLVEDQNKTQVIKKLLEHQSVKDGTTVLQKLIISNCFQLVIDLLRYKPNLEMLVNDNHTYRDSLLNLAISENSLELVKCLISEGANVLKFPNKLGDIRNETNALMNAACYGTPEIFKEIVKACPVDIFKNGTYGSGQALLDCIENLPIDCIKLLLNLGVNVKTVINTHNVFTQAVWTNDVKKMKFIVDQFDRYKFLNKQNGFGDYALTIHVKNQVDVVDYFLRLGGKLNLVNRKGMSPLHYACLSGNYEVVKILLVNGADTEQINNKGNIPVQSAAKSKSVDTFKLLFNSNSHLEIRNFKGNTLLMTATKSNNYFIVKELINAGADVNEVDFNNNTALHFAEDADIINILIENGANKMAVNNERNTPYLSMAVKIENDIETKKYTTNREISIKNHLSFDIDYSKVNHAKKNLLHYILQDVDNCYETYAEIFKEKKFEPLFEYTGCDLRGRTIFLLACNVKNAPVELFEKIITCSNPDLNSKSYDGTCAIQTLVERGNSIALEYILKKGANVDILTNANSETPLISAASNSVEMVELLLKYGAYVNRQDALGATALHKAIQKDSFHVARILVAAGADLKIKDFYDKTALDYDENGYMKEFFKPFN